MPWGGKKQESTPGNYVIRNYLSQPSVVIINALKMLTCTYLEKKKDQEIKHSKTTSFSRQCGMNLEIRLLFVAPFWQVPSPGCCHLSSYQDKELGMIDAVPAAERSTEPQEMFSAQKKVTQDTPDLARPQLRLA